MRSFISAAAASVNVTTRRSVTEQRSGASQTRYAQRSASTDVFPDPAAADTSTLPVARIALSCSSVHLRGEVEAADSAMIFTVVLGTGASPIVVPNISRQ